MTICNYNFRSFVTLCGKPLRYTALAWINIQASLVFLARLLLSLH